MMQSSLFLSPFLLVFFSLTFVLLKTKRTTTPSFFFTELLECENGQYSCGLLSVAEEMCAQIGSAKFEELILPTCLKLYEKTHLLSLQVHLSYSFYMLRL